MNRIFIICFVFIANFAQAQEFKTFELLPPESKEYSDLQFLNNELQGKSLVMLGEMTHMYGNIFEMKARVIEYLHKELGFTTIAMESSMYDLWVMNKNGFTTKEFNNAIWGVWSSSLEFQRLVQYIEANNIKVIGFDSQVNNTSQFVEDFYDYCESQNIEFKVDEDDLGIIIEGVLENVTVEEDDIKYKVYEKELNRIIQQIAKLESNETNYYWHQFTKSLLACSQDAYFNKNEILTTDFGNKNDNIRDKQMAENLLSYIHRNPNEKIICWADNVHVMNDNSSIKKSVAKEFISMGSYIKNDLKDKSYSLATIHANDSLFDSGTWYSTPILKNSFEYELNNINKPYLFLSSNQVAMQITKETRLLNFVDFTEARLDQLHDGYIFFQNATLPKNEIESIIISEKQFDLGKKIEQIEVGQSVILKGQILDQESNTPIPFATLILKKEEIYRVADENGFYELPIKKKMIDNASVAISSIGFESNTFLLKELKDKTYLNSRFETLAEVVLIGHLTPKAVLKSAISKKKLNHPVEPFNFYRYGKVLVNKNDVNELDLELITKDYDLGYLTLFRTTQRVEQIKWNTNKNSKKYKYYSQIQSHRESAIRYANILHKRKYKKFKLDFVKSNDSENDGLYIIAFETERNKWNYTNRPYPTKYSGRVYIDKKSFAIVKVIENWETALKENEIEKYFKGYKMYEKYQNKKQITIKEENICNYSDIMGNGKYYPTKHFNRSYNESLDKENKKENSVYERNSYSFDFELENVEEIEYEFRLKEQTVLNRVKYDKSFWVSFYKREIKGKSE